MWELAFSFQKALLKTFFDFPRIHGHMFVLKYENNLYRCNKNAEKEQKRKFNKRVFMGSRKIRGNSSSYKGKKELRKITNPFHLLTQ